MTVHLISNQHSRSLTGRQYIPHCARGKSADVDYAAQSSRKSHELFKIARVLLKRNVVVRSEFGREYVNAGC